MPDSPITSDSGTMVQVDTTQWPVYATKAALIQDLYDALNGKGKIKDIIQRVSNTDVTTWTDKASRLTGY